MLSSSGPRVGVAQSVSTCVCNQQLRAKLDRSGHSSIRFSRPPSGWDDGNSNPFAALSLALKTYHILLLAYTLRNVWSQGRPHYGLQCRRHWIPPVGALFHQVLSTTAHVHISSSKEFAKRGHTVYATARNVEKMIGLPVGIHTLALDVLEDAAVQRVVAQVVAEQGRVDVLVNNAGAGCVGMTF